MTAEAITLDITMPELHKHIKAYQMRNPSISDAQALLEMAINERWPGLRIDDVLRQAEINWIALDRRNMVRDAARNLNEWVDTTVQGDMFNDIASKVPRWILRGQDPVEYWKCSPTELKEYLITRAQQVKADAMHYRNLANEKDNELRRIEAEIEHTNAIIKRATDAGLNPDDLRYEKPR